MSHDAFRLLHIALAYGVAGGCVLFMTLHLILDHRSLKRDLEELGATDRERGA